MWTDRRPIGEPISAARSRSGLGRPGRYRRRSRVLLGCRDTPGAATPAFQSALVAGLALNRPGVNVRGNAKRGAPCATDQCRRRPGSARPGASCKAKDEGSDDMDGQPGILPHRLARALVAVAKDAAVS